MKGLSPADMGSDGLVLSECIPLTLYFAFQSDDPSYTLLGDSRNDTLKILQWMSANSDLFPAVGGVFLPRIGRRQIIRQDNEDSLRVMLQRCKYIDEHLKTSK
ncbi:hypothetical protein BDW74DRAFT_178496 [Aspergillus multicolor]|uniref:uncharacterized protein n=1 Tax=Aspergillus multicolor TaxID=41759 RepID=UPI003CCCA2B2